MIRDKTSNVEVLTNLGRDRLKMGIDEEGMIHVTDLLTNMYKDSEKAVLREYSINAIDSHIEAGQDRPIEITLPCPSWRMPDEKKGRFLRIKDYGVGLSIEEIAEVYSRYGKSTKNDTNEQEGMMGIGGKSGLAEPFNGFKITGIKNGEKAVVTAGRDEDGAPVMDLVSITETDEPNGVEIELTTPKYNDLERKAKRLFRFWSKGSVLVDGVEPETLKPHIEITPDMWVVSDTHISKSYIVMGRTPYPVELDTKLADGYHLVIRVPIGAVNITPSREDLMLTRKTKDELARLLAEFDQHVKTVVQTKVSEAKNKAEAMQVALSWRRAFGTTADLGVKYKGQKVPMTFDAPDGESIGIVMSAHGSEKLSAHDKNKTIGAAPAARSLLIHGWNAAKFTPVMKKKLIKYAMENGLIKYDDAKDDGDKIEYYVLTDNRLAPGWFPAAQRVDYETIKAYRITHTRGRDGIVRPKGSYNGYVASIWIDGIEAQNIDTSKPIFYQSKRAFRGSWHSKRGKQFEFVQELYPDAYVIELPDNRVAKFCRDFPMARRTWEALHEERDKIIARVSKSDLRVLAMKNLDYGHTIAHLQALDANRVDDPDIRKAIRQAKKQVSPTGEKALTRLKELGWYNELVLPEIKLVSVTDRYPLANISARHIEHTYIYMNAVYAAAQESKVKS